MIDVYNILNHKNDPKVSNVLPLHIEIIDNSSTKGHYKKLYKYKPKLDVSHPLR